MALLEPKSAEGVHLFFPRLGCDCEKIFIHKISRHDRYHLTSAPYAGVSNLATESPVVQRCFVTMGTTHACDSSSVDIGDHFLYSPQLFL